MRALLRDAARLARGMWKDHALEDPARLRETEEGVMPLEAPRAERMLAAVSDAGRLRRAL